MLILKVEYWRSSRKGWENNSYTGEGTEGKYLFDGLHPNSDGYQLLSDYFSRQINKICRNSMGK